MTGIPDNLPIGVRSRSVGRTLTLGEIRLMDQLTTDWGPEAPAAAASDDRLSEPNLAVLVATLASNTAPLHRELASRHGIRTVAAMGLEAEFHGSVRAGDTLWAETWIDSIRASASRAGTYVLTIRDEGQNQHGQVLVELTRPILVEIRA